MRQNGQKSVRYAGVYRVSDNLFRIRVKAIDPRTGKRRDREKLVTTTSVQEAARLRVELQKELRGGTDQQTARTKVGDFARSWIKAKALVVDRSTGERYVDALENHILPVLGEFYFDALRPSDVQDWISREVAAKKKPSTIRGWFSVFRTMARDAVVQLDLPKDPSQRVVLPEEPIREDLNSVTPDELAKFLGVMERDWPQNFALAATLAFTGLRFNHASAVKWEDIDEQAGVIHIRRKQVRGRVGEVSHRKRAPVRYPLHPELAAILKRHREWQVENQVKGLEDGWVFPARNGKLRRPGSLVKCWRDCLRKAGIPHRVTVSGMRRTFNDLGRLAGVSGITLRSLTGHVTERMTAHYSSVRLEEQRLAVAGVLRLVPLGGGGGVDAGVDGESEKKKAS